MTIRVVAAEPLEPYRVRLTFSDGIITEADFADDLWGPVSEPLRDPEVFRQLRVDAESRTIVWPTGFDPDPEVLHGDHAPAPPSRLRVRRLTAAPPRGA